MAKKPTQAHEAMWTFGPNVRVEVGPAPGEQDKLAAALRENPPRDYAVARAFYVYQLQDDDPTDSQDGVWKLVGHWANQETAFAKAADLAG